MEGSNIPDTDANCKSNPLSSIFSPIFNFLGSKGIPGTSCELSVLSHIPAVNGTLRKVRTRLRLNVVFVLLTSSGQGESKKSPSTRHRNQGVIGGKQKIVAYWV